MYVTPLTAGLFQIYHRTKTGSPSQRSETAGKEKGVWVGGWGGHTTLITGSRPAGRATS